MALIIRVVKPETMKLEDLVKMHESFHIAFRGSPAYIDVEICLCGIDTLKDTGETYFPLILGIGTDDDTTITLNAEDVFKSMHKYVSKDLE